MLQNALQSLGYYLRSDEKGASTTEYAVMLFLVAIGVLAFGQGIAGSVTGAFLTIINALN